MTSPTYDRAAFIDRMGDEELAREIEELFLETLDAQLTSIRTCVGDGDAHALEATLHKLKGTLANLGARRALDAAAQAESSARQARLDLVALEALFREVDALRTDVVSARDARMPGESSKPP